MTDPEARGPRNPAPTLVLGIGNLLLGDEGFGVHAVRRLASEGVPAGVDLEDGGTGGVDLLDRIAAHGRVIVIDAVRLSPQEGSATNSDRDSRTTGGAGSGGASRRAPFPGEVVVFRPNRVEVLNPDPDLSLHEASLGALLRLAGALGVDLPPITVVGYVLGGTEWSTDLSPAGDRALDRAVTEVRALIAASGTE